MPYADVVTTTTHKTLRGPRGGLILCREEYAKAIDKAIFPGTQGGPLEHIIAAKAVCFGEALKPEFKEYQKNIAENARVLAQALLDEGLGLVSGGTDNHLMTVDLRGTGVTGKELERRLDEVHLSLIHISCGRRTPRVRASRSGGRNRWTPQAAGPSPARAPPAPVSYTHLDVYKRQVYHILARSSSSRAERISARLCTK